MVSRLEDGKTVSYYNIGKESTLQLLPCWRADVNTLNIQLKKVKDVEQMNAELSSRIKELTEKLTRAETTKVRPSVVVADGHSPYFIILERLDYKKL